MTSWPIVFYRPPDTWTLPAENDWSNRDQSQPVSVQASEMSKRSSYWRVSATGRLSSSLAGDWNFWTSTSQRLLFHCWKRVVREEDMRQGTAAFNQCLTNESFVSPWLKSCSGAMSWRKCSTAEICRWPLDTFLLAKRILLADKTQPQLTGPQRTNRSLTVNSAAEVLSGHSLRLKRLRQRPAAPRSFCQLLAEICGSRVVDDIEPHGCRQRPHQPYLSANYSRRYVLMGLPAGRTIGEELFRQSSS